jgi:hypothetical protein
MPRAVRRARTDRSEDAAEKNRRWSKTSGCWAASSAT